MKIFTCLFLILFSFKVKSELACSANGTDIIYVSNNNLFKNQVLDNRTELSRQLTKAVTIEKIDKEKKVTVHGFENISFGTANNLKNTFLAVAKENGVKNPEQMYSLLSSGSGLIDDLASNSPYYNAMKKFMGVVDGINKYEYFKAQKSWDTAVYRLFLANNEEELEQLVFGLKTEIQSRLSNRKKVILMPHGHGGLLTTDALKQLIDDPVYGTPVNSQDPSRKGLVQKFVGEVRVASYSSIKILEALKTRTMKLNFDLPSTLIGDGANYNPVEPSLIGMTRSINSFSDYYLNAGSLNGVPLIIKANVNQGGFEVPTRTNEILRSLVIEVATNLEDNCKSPDIDIEVSGAVKDITNPGFFNYQGFTNYNNKISITATDKNDLDETTAFSFKYQGQFVENVKTIYDFPIPFSTAPFTEIPLESTYSYNLEVIATNKFGKTISKGFGIRVPEDKPPVVKIISQDCVPDCAYGCEGAVSIPYYLAVNVQDSDSSSVNNFSVLNVQPDEVNFTLMNTGGSIEPLTITFKSSYKAVTRFTVPACAE